MNKRDFTPRAILRRNLKALMEMNGAKVSQSELHRRSGVAQSTIGRILGPDGEDSGIETVDKLAKAFSLEGWQLLVAGMDPTNPPVLQAVSKEERALYDRLKALAKDLRETR